MAVLLLLLSLLLLTSLFLAALGNYSVVFLINTTTTK
jgi:hypothetical protein